MICVVFEVVTKYKVIFVIKKKKKKKVLVYREEIDDLTAAILTWCTGVNTGVFNYAN